MDRHNQELEQDSVAMHEEQRKLEREARSLALRLDAVLKDKFTPRTSFDADTPIDKTLKFLQKVIAVGVIYLWRTCDTACMMPVRCANPSSSAHLVQSSHRIAQHKLAQQGIAGVTWHGTGRA